MALARYTFLPWLRRGAANAISSPATAQSRADLHVELAVSDGTVTGTPIQKTFQLVGPSDVIGINPDAVVRTEPRAGAMDFEPNYLPFVEFYDEDFCSRHTPAPPDGGHRLVPWITLVVLAEGEFARGFAPGRPLSSFVVTAPDPPSFFPPDGQVWAWAHVQIVGEVGGGNAPDPGRLAQVLADAPDRGISRLVCPRRLSPNTIYHAFVVPTFEVGRKAGLGLAIDDASESGTSLSWRSGAAEFPIYYEWRFGTGTAGDFEDLVQRIVPRRVPDRVGVRDMDIAAPGFGMPQVPVADDNTDARVVGLEGAVKAPTMRPKPDGPVSAASGFPSHAAPIVNRPAVAQAEGDPEPVIAPPLVGGWHVLRDKIDPAGMPGWIDELNLDPRDRAAAGLGARVVRANQERYMRLAWEQVGEVLAANRRAAFLRFAQAAAHKSFGKNVASFPPARALAVVAPVFARVLGSPRTIRALVHESRMPDAAVSPAFRALTRARGATMRRALPAAVRQGAAARFAVALNDGEISAAPTPPPVNGPTLEQIADRTEEQQAGTPGFLKPSGWIALALLLAALAAFLFLGGVAGIGLAGALVAVAASVVAAARRQRARIAAARKTRLAELTPEAVSQSPPPARFALSQPGTTETPTPDAVAAADFGAALSDFAAYVAARPQPAPERPSFDFGNAHAKVMAAVTPDAAYPRRAAALIRIGDRSITDYVREAYAGTGGTGGEPAAPRIAPVMAYPDFKEAMYRPLAGISEDLLAPNIALVQPNTISLMLTNPPFIEAYMAGVNHAFAAELLWREYPTDSRGTPFRQFWEVTGAPTPGLSTAARAAALKDILPLHTWPPDTELGQHPNTGRGSVKEDVVLVLRGDLLKRYPNTIVYAQRARWSPDPRHANELALFDETGEKALAGILDPDIAYPLFAAPVPPDLTFVGFKLQLEEVRGDPDLEETAEARASIPADKLGWFFVLQEALAEPRLGLDEQIAPLEMQSETKWDNFAWPHIDMSGRNTIDLGRPLASAPPGSDPSPVLRWASGDGATSADIAAILNQKPVLVAWHARQMLERGKID